MENQAGSNRYYSLSLSEEVVLTQVDFTNKKFKSLCSHLRFLATDGIEGFHYQTVDQAYES